MYDLKNLEIEDVQVEPKGWTLKSFRDPKTNYRLMSKDALDHFDFKKRFLLKADKKTY